jgi:hypothetical protein
LERVNGDQFLNPFDKTNVAVGAKYLITRQNETPGQELGGTRVALGAGYSRALLRNTHAYVVASRDFGGLSASNRPNAVGHFGLRYDDFDATRHFAGT